MSLITPPDVAALNDVIRTARECEQAFLDSAEKLGDGPLKSALEARAKDRDALAEALCAVVRDRGELPPADTGPDERRLAGEFWSDIVARVVGDREAPLRDFCLKAETKLLAAIETARAEDLPDAASEALNGFADKDAEASLNLPAAS